MPTESDAVSFTADIDTVRVEPANAQVVAAAAGGGIARSTRPQAAAVATAANSTQVPLAIPFVHSCAPTLDDGT